MPSGPKEGQTAFGWDLTYLCNYRCPYCTVWDQPTKLKSGVEEWLAVWRRLRERHGRCYIYMSGGEPSAYRHFGELVEALTPLHTVDVCTNLSWDVRRLVPEQSPEHLRIAASFHPSQVPFADFVEKAVRVRDYLPERPEGKTVYFVADPRQIDKMEYYRESFAARDLAMVPLPYVQAAVPGNCAAEKERIAAISPNRDGADRKLDYQLRTRTPKGRLCRAGQRYAMIRGDGTVDRCSRHEDRALGSLLDPAFRLWEEPRECALDWCPYESQWIVEK